MPNINVLSLPIILQKICQVKVFLTAGGTDRQTNRRTDQWDLMSPYFAEARGQNCVMFWPNVVSIECFACRANGTPN